MRNVGIKFGEDVLNTFIKKEIGKHKWDIVKYIVLNLILISIIMGTPLIQGQLVDVFVYSKI